MNLTLESDYAIRIVLFIAKVITSKEDSRVDANTISEKTDVTLRFSLKILRKLVSGKILISYKGLHGGYTLSRDPEDISLKDIVQIVEGEYAFSRCLLPEIGCCRNENDGHIPCKVREVFLDITTLVNDKLSKTTVRDLLD